MATDELRSETLHVPVLREEVVALVGAERGGRFADATVGAGGHAEAILEAAGPKGELVGLDRDPEALAAARRRLARFGPRVHLREASFADLALVLDELGWDRVDGIVADLGLSSMQLADARRGFSFAHEGPLDMRFSPRARTTAAELVNRLGEKELADLLYTYGEERRSRAIARRIVARRPLTTTTELRRAVLAAVGPARRGGIDPATRTFQALRIAVNDELAALEAFLAAAMERLGPGGRLVVLSYHSLEDRIVKRAFRARVRGGPGFRLLTAKPVRAGEDEVRKNRRARSAKLRALARSE